MNAFTAVVIEDEHLDAMDLRLTLDETEMFHNILVFDSVVACKKWLQKQEQPVDFIFCDIEMPHVDGIQARTLLKSYTNFFVFCTGHEKYSLMGHDLHVDGYLMKPVGEDKVLSLIDLFREKQKGASELPITYLMLDEVLKTVDVAGRKFVKVQIADISHLKKDGNYVYAYGDVKDIEKRDFQKLGVFDGELKAFMKKYWYLHNFVRINRAEILNMDWVDSVFNDAVEIKKIKFHAKGRFRPNLDRHLRIYSPNFRK